MNLFHRGARPKMKKARCAGIGLWMGGRSSIKALR